jgi:formamidopyrimidine-DNA glycosylase
MPELPEVEIVRRSLQKIVSLEPIIIKVNLFRPDIRFVIPKIISKKLVNQKIVSVERRAKYLLFKTPVGYLLSHLGMTGSWRILKLNEAYTPHDHFSLKFKDGRELVFRDPRRFGMIDFVENGATKTHIRLKNLGPEPLDQAEFTGEYLFSQIKNRKSPIKNFIMDQKFVVGVGNIYASEVLFAAKINPQKKAYRLSKNECLLLVHMIQKTLSSAIERGGSTIRDFISSDGAYGSFQNNFSVYGRGGQTCRKCGATIKTKMFSGRSTFWCPHCQK